MVNTMANRQNKRQLYGNNYVNIRDGALYVDEFSVLDLSTKFSTPAFIFLLDKVKANIQKIQECFTTVFPNSHGFYSVKSNYLTPVVNAVKKTGFGAEIITSVELEILENLHFPMNKVLAGGPYLPDQTLQAFLKAKVEYLVIYNIEDIPRIEKTLQNTRPQDANPQKILIRFRAPRYSARHGVVLNPENLKRLEQTLKDAPHLTFKGILSHMGTRMRALKNYQNNLTYIQSILEDLKTHTSLVPTIIDIGGGFPNADAIKKPQFIEILQAVRSTLKEAGWDHCSIFYEPGRFIVGDVGFCITQVFQKSSEYSTLFVNVGNNLIPKFMKSALRFYNATQITETPNTPMDFMGNVPSDQDILVKNYNTVKHPKIADIYLIANLGAYSLTWSTRFPYPFPVLCFIENHNILPIED